MTVSIYRAHKPTVLAMLAVLGSLTIAVLALGAGSASAAPGYAFVPPAFGNLNLAVGVAVDNSGGASNGDVFGVAKEGKDVEKFNAEGESAEFTELHSNVLTDPEAFIGPVDAAVSNAGNIYVTSENEPGANPGTGNVREFNDTTGAPIALAAGAFVPPAGALHEGHFEPFGIAVDNSESAGDPSKGDVYVSDHEDNAIDVFTSAGVYVRQIKDAHISEPDTIAVNSNGDVYESNRYKTVREYSPTGTFIATIDENNTQAVAVDPSTNDVYVVGTLEGYKIREYNSTGEEIAHFAEGLPFPISTYGMAVNSTTHTVYVPNIESGSIDRFEIGEGPETPVTEAATEETGTTAKLHGKLNPGGRTGALEYYFAYNTTGSCEGGGTAPASPEKITEGKEAPVTVEATGLSPKKEYTFCLVAKNPFGSAVGSPLKFTTTEAAPEIEEEKFISSTPTTAQLETKINPGGAATTCKVEYGLTEAYGHEMACTPEALGEGTEGVTATVELTGLEPGKEYHYRFSGTNSVKTEPGTDSMFTTKPLVEVETRTQSEVTGEGATLNGGIKTGSEGGSYQFEYLEGAVGVGNLEAGTKTKLETIAGETNGFQAVSAAVSGLTPSTTYHYRIVGYPAGSVIPIEGAEAEFTTSAAKPKVIAESAGNEERHSVALSGELNPEGAETRYYFEYATEEAYDEAVAQKKSNPYSEVPVGEGGTTSEATTATAVTPVKVGPVTAIELHAGTIYHYRLVAVNSTGTSYGPDHTFETEEPQFPFVESEPQPPFGEEVTQEVTSPTTASIKAKVNADGLPTSYVLEIGTEVVNGRPVYSTPTFGEVGSNLEPVPLTFQLTNLLPGTTYHYRVVVFNEDGTFVGADHAFATGIFPSVIAAPASVQLVPTPVEVKPPPPPKEETNTQKLAKALKLCKKQPKKKQAACDRKAKNKYGPKKAKKKAKKK